MRLSYTLEISSVSTGSILSIKNVELEHCQVENMAYFFKFKILLAKIT